ncbi:hypothetical protein POSPLADRAFT_1041349 [Postia placenta MAD-698-R-SB12]|uniref:Uncharacterized protein n=1 Tax=Postia placenta MAD-698-R-SB12 TaxID=670580 RepID=A0A1X6MP37_9APHY|nr:hypothetical protein POSPLADRAFT_1041349 [Postia placenta MAD-698-R-SB12]OSX58135.1 hypothetical protein POSPLADRAFT_1041349 [Postia placenta MAD-698-R-SB12]
MTDLEGISVPQSSAVLHLAIDRDPLSPRQRRRGLRRLMRNTTASSATMNARNRNICVLPKDLSVAISSMSITPAAKEFESTKALK